MSKPSFITAFLSRFLYEGVNVMPKLICTASTACGREPLYFRGRGAAGDRDAAPPNGLASQKVVRSERARRKYTACR
jgi:hypothetical protein